MTCLGFDKGWNGFVGSNWGYFNDFNVERVMDTPTRGHSAKFNGTSRLEFHSLVNRYNVFDSFSVSLWYKRHESEVVSIV